jgi:hypothetical protein
MLNGFATFLSFAAAWWDVELFSLTEQQVKEFSAIVKLSVCGDDSLCRLPHREEAWRAAFADRVRANIRKFGFEAKLKYSEHLMDAVYLGSRPYPTRSGWFWGRTIGRAAYKMGWVREPEHKDLMAHITGIADMHSLCSNHVPILSDMAAVIKRLRQGAKRTPVVADVNRPWEWTFSGGVPYDDLTLLGCVDCYSRQSGKILTLEDFSSLRECIHKVERLPCVIYHPLMELILSVDEM